MNLFTRSFYSDFNWKKGLYLLATGYIAWMFFAHGVQVLLFQEKFMPLALQLLPESMASKGLIAAGLFDLAIVALLLLRNHPLVLFYTALYPFLPLMLNYFATGQLEMIGKFVIFGCSIISFALWTQFKTKPLGEAIAA